MGLENIPDELIQHILFHVSPEDNLRHVHAACRRLNRLCNESLLWRYHCQHSFIYWESSHELEQKLAAKVSDTDWKALFLLRKSRNAHISRLFDGILTSKLGRMGKFEQICLFGYDAKDFLLGQSATPNTHNEVLARRYYGKALLSSLRRGLALEVWSTIRDQQPLVDPRGVPPQHWYRDVERALAALDMFVIRDDSGDMENTSRLLDEIASQFQDSQPRLGQMCIRDKALALNRWLRIQNLTGMENPQTEFRNLRNCFIGQALRDEDHPSLPLISAAIYCSIAGRLGLNAHCAAIPGHVHAVVYAQQHVNLEGEPVSATPNQVDRMFLDPYGSDREVTQEDLRILVLSLGWHSEIDDLFEPMSPSTQVLRMTRNIKSTFTALRGPIVARNESMAGLLRGNPSENLELAVYGAAWAMLILSSHHAGEFSDHSRQLAFWFRSHQSEDIWLIDKYYLPLSEKILGSPSEDLSRYIRREDAQVPRPKVRTPEMTFKVGQVVRHSRFDNLGVIYGWRFHAGQPFYDCMIDDGPVGIVAKPNNLELVTNPDLITSFSFEKAGLYFKRFDRKTCSFVSNVTEEFPEG